MHTNVCLGSVCKQRCDIRLNSGNTMIFSSTHFSANGRHHYICFKDIFSLFKHIDPVPTIVALKEPVVWTDLLAQDPCRLCTSRWSCVLYTLFFFLIPKTSANICGTSANNCRSLPHGAHSCSFFRHQDGFQVWKIIPIQKSVSVVQVTHLQMP